MKKIDTKLAEWRKLDKKGLVKQYHEMTDQLTKLKIAFSLQKEKDATKTGKLRKDIARVKTLLNEERS